MIEKQAVWFITGCSKGLGRALAREVLQAGYRLVATARRKEDLHDLVETAPEMVFPVELDVTKPEQIASAVAAAEQRFGAIDVLVNNAGNGYLGAIEEGDDAGVRLLFETNVFAPVNLIKAVLPGMRKRRSGYVVNLSSIGGLTAFPGIGYYHMTKFAIEGLWETLAKELAPFGIGVMVVEPGAFRTDFRGGSMQQSNVRLPEYADSVGKLRDNLLAKHGQQPGNPELGAQVMLKALQADKPPVHLVIGSDAVDLVRQKITDLQKEVDAWEDLARSTDYPGAGPGLS